MKIYMLILLVLIYASINAQNTNFTVTDCSNNETRAHDVLNQGYVIIIASTGIDCGACQSAAPTVGGFASNNLNKIKVWGAMNFRYSNNTPTCVELFDWRNNYFWNDILMFIDNTNTWEADGYPAYFVIEPEQKTIVLQTYSFNEAATTAQAIADTAEVSTNVVNIEKDLVNIYTYSNNLYISSYKDASLQLIDLQGKVHDEIVLLSSKTPSQKNLNHLQKGMYIVQINIADSKEIKRKKIWVY